MIIKNEENEKNQNLVVQIRKAIDLGGDFPVQFQDGNKVKLSAKAMANFLDKYEAFKPCDREEMQKLAIQSKQDFDKIITDFVRPVAPKSIYC